MGFAIPVDTAPMEARSVEQLPAEGGWQFEPKWDGFRCLAFRDGDTVELMGKSGKSLARWFPEMVAALRACPAPRFVVDGELAVPVGDTLSFAALQDRLHPAESRVRKLSVATPSVFVAFDCLADGGTVLSGAELGVRRAALERLDLGPRVRLTPFTGDRGVAQGWLDRTHGALDGVVAKRGVYAPGQRAMLKVKRLRTADCVVGGFRYASVEKEGGSKEVGSLLLGLYNEAGLLDHVGFTSGLSRGERPGLTARLEGLAGGTGFTGDAPGGPSRWATERSVAWVPLRPELVVEVRYDHVTGGRFRHGTGLVRWRPDKAPGQCTMEQLQEEARPGALVESLRL